MYYLTYLIIFCLLCWMVKTYANNHISTIRTTQIESQRVEGARLCGNKSVTELCDDFMLDL